MGLNMTADQYEHLLAQQKSALKVAKQRKGQAPPPREAKEVQISKHNMHMQQRLRDMKYHIQTTFIPAAYAPCTKALAELQKMMICDLRCEEHHRGRYLLLRVLTTPDRITGIMTVVEDEQEEATTLVVYQMEDERVRSARSFLDTAVVVLVKEPYFKLMGDGAYGLRVDHLSDVRCLNCEDQRVPLRWQPRFVEVDKSASKWKEEGDRAVKLKKFWGAIESYTEALKAPGPPQELEIIRRNRALAFLKTEHYDATLVDLGYPFQDSDTVAQSDKALFRMSQALYSLRRFRECSEVLKILLKTYPTQVEAKNLFTRIISRLLEQEKGAFNFKTIYATLSKTGLPILDHASYIGPVEILDTCSRGRGLFTTKDVKAGDLLLCEKAFAYCYADDEQDIKGSSKMTLLINPETDLVKMGTDADLIKVVVQKLSKNPSLIPEFMALHHGDYQTVPADEVDGVPVVDTFLVERIIAFNAFASPLTSRAIHVNHMHSKTSIDNPTSSHHSSGIWLRASYINHSCISNCYRTFIGDLQIIRATQDLAAGTELVFPYNHTLLSHGYGYDVVQDGLKHWGFVCTCELCSREKNTNEKTLKKRAASVAEMSKIFDSSVDNYIKLDVGKIERLLAAIEQTYEGYPPHVPRTDMWAMYLALAGTQAALVRPTKVISVASKVLQMLGFAIKGAEYPSRKGESRNLVVERWGVVLDDVVESWMLLWTAFALLKDWERAESAKAYAKCAYRIVVGEDISFEGVYGEKGERAVMLRSLWTLADLA